MNDTASYRKVATVLLIGGLSVFISGCGMTLSPVKRKPVQVLPLETTLPTSSQKIVFHFESTLPGKPLTETVWDNRAGAFADLLESRRIGYTQDYGQVAAEAALGCSGDPSVMAKPEYTQIFIPFGRIFQGVFESGIQKVYPKAVVSLDNLYETDKMEVSAPWHVVRLKVAEYRVWEKPLNHLNMSAVVECRVYDNGLADQPTYIYEARHQMTNQPIGSATTTSSGFIREMNKMSNRFAGALSEEILEDLQKKHSEATAVSMLN